MLYALFFVNINEAWVYGRFHLADSFTPYLDAQLLLQHFLQVEHTYLIGHGDEMLTAVQQTAYKQLIKRAVKQEPIPYITGTAPFYGRDFNVTPAVLIPRPETEQLVELAIAWAKPRGSIEIVDVGTGSGCIAISLAGALPQANITAIDISADALTIAQKNGEKHVPGQITLRQGNLLSPLQKPVDLIVANLPYITSKEWTQLDDGVKLYEPKLALKGGKDGLDLIRDLLQQATTKLKPNGAIFIEIGWQQGQAAEQLARSVFPGKTISLRQDFGVRDRIIEIKGIGDCRHPNL